MSGPDRLKAGGRTNQVEGSEDGPDMLKVLRVVQIGGRPSKAVQSC